ncbi:MAG: hypothetical protein ACREFK_08425 [Stellaceae bacterium]
MKAITVLIGAALAAAVSHSVFAAETHPTFSNFGASPWLYEPSKVPAPDLSTHDAWIFRTRLRRAAKEPPNFAGHYVVTQWGCGTDCFTGAAIDLKNGHIVWLPITISDVAPGPEALWVYVRGSKLFEVEGYAGLNDDNHGGSLPTRYFVMDNDRFSQIAGPPVRNDAWPVSQKTSSAPRAAAPAVAAPAAAQKTRPFPATVDGVPIEHDAVPPDVPRDTAIAMVKIGIQLALANGYTCSSVSAVSPFVLSRGFYLECNDFAYKYEISDHGRGWEFKAD